MQKTSASKALKILTISLLLIAAVISLTVYLVSAQKGGGRK